MAEEDSVSERLLREKILQSQVRSLITNAAPPGAAGRRAVGTLSKRALAVILRVWTPCEAQGLYASCTVICILMVMNWVGISRDRDDIPVRTRF